MTQIEMTELVLAARALRADELALQADVAGIDAHIDRLAKQRADLHATRVRVYAEYSAKRIEREEAQLAINSKVAMMIEPEGLGL